MEAKTKTSFLVGEGSGNLSDFSVWEGFTGAGNLLIEKGVSVGNYFCVGQVTNKKLYPPNIAKYDLFVAGHLPYHIDSTFSIKRRRYSRLLTHFADEIYEEHFTPSQIDEIKSLLKVEAKEEYHFCQSQIYQLLNEERNFSLAMKNGDWLNPLKADGFFNKVMENKKVVPLSDSGIFLYSPTVETEKSRGYYLKGFKYIVRSVIVGTPSLNMSGHDQKVLCVDVLSGVPGLVPYFKEAKEFSLIQ